MARSRKSGSSTSWSLPAATAGLPEPFAARVRYADATAAASAYGSGDYEVVAWEGGEEALAERPVFAARPHVVRFDAPVAAAVMQRHEVPDVPGAFMLSNVLTAEECSQLLAVSEAMGYTDWMGLETCIWMADDTIQGPVFERCRALLPAQLGGGAVCGLHSRWRFYRYSRDDDFEAHLDGSYPGSAVVGGALVHDAHPGQRWSQLTFLLYLNEDFEGGETAFFVEGAAGAQAAVRVRPAQGAALCFHQQGHPPNLHAHLSPLHEGSTVRKGCKYVIRSDVMYELPRP